MKVLRLDSSLQMVANDLWPIDAATRRCQGCMDLLTFFADRSCAMETVFLLYSVLTVLHVGQGLPCNLASTSPCRTVATLRPVSRV